MTYEKKKFDGKIFNLAGRHTNKKDAEEHAKGLRNSGFARVYKCTKSGETHPYQVWFRIER